MRSRRAKDAAGNKNKMREEKGRKKKRKPVTRKVSRLHSPENFYLCLETCVDHGRIALNTVPKKNATSKDIKLFPS